MILLDIIKKFLGNNISSIIKVILCIAVVGIIIGIIGYYNGKINEINDNNTKALNELAAQNNKLLEQNTELINEIAKLKDNYMTMDTNEKTQTVIEYVEKESPDDADFEVNQNAPKVVVNTGDDQKIEYQPSVQTSSHIKDGKMVMTTDSTLELDIEKVVDARFNDKLETINLQHEFELQARDDIIDEKNKELKRVRMQRDIYGGIAIIGTGIGIVKEFDL